MQGSRPLKSGDRFLVGLNMLRESRLRFVFAQDVIRLPDEVLMVQGRITGTSLNERGRPAVLEEVERLLSESP